MSFYNSFYNKFSIILSNEKTVKMCNNPITINITNVDNNIQKIIFLTTVIFFKFKSCKINNNIFDTYKFIKRDHHPLSFIN